MMPLPSHHSSEGTTKVPKQPEQLDLTSDLFKMTCLCEHPHELITMWSQTHTQDIEPEFLPLHLYSWLTERGFKPRLQSVSQGFFFWRTILLVVVAADYRRATRNGTYHTFNLTKRGGE